MTEEKKKKKTNGCLISLILILIFSALGFVAYEGFTVGAKKASAKNIYNEIVQFSVDEIKKCNLGSDTYMDNLKCPVEPKKTIEKLLEIYTKLYNPFTFDENKLPGGSLYKEGILPASHVFKKNMDVSNDDNIGFINLDFTNQNLTFEICFDTPCTKKENRLQNSIEIE